VTIAGRKSNTRFGDDQPHEPLLEFRENIGSFRLTMVLQKDKGFSIANPQKCSHCRKSLLNPMLSAT
jgi:hypothetical protein